MIVGGCPQVDMDEDASGSQEDANLSGRINAGWQALREWPI